MAALTVWTNPLAALLPGATTPQIEEKLRHAMKEFFLQSHAWRTVLGPFTVTAATVPVTLTPPANSQVVWVRDVWLQEGGVQTFLCPNPREITESRSAKPTHFYFDPPTGIVQLWPTPDTTLTNTLFAEVALTPTDAATTVPDLAATHFFDAIQDGALARLLMMPNKPWTDHMLAARYSQIFRRRCLELRAVSDSGYTRSDPPQRFPAFA